MRRLLLIFGLALAPATHGLADDTVIARLDHVVIIDGWARASLGRNPNSTAYMTLEVEGSSADRLISAASPMAEKVELHTHLMDNGIARMRPVPAIDLAPGATTTLEPGGFHIMLIGLKERLLEGARVPLTLTFEHAGELDVELPVHGSAPHVHGHGHGLGHDNGHGS